MASIHQLQSFKNSDTVLRCVHNFPTFMGIWLSISNVKRYNHCEATRNRTKVYGFGDRRINHYNYSPIDRLGTCFIRARTTQILSKIVYHNLTYNANTDIIQTMIVIEVPIYLKDIHPRAAKNALIGMNWYNQSCNVFKHHGRSNTVSAIVKKKYHELIYAHKDAIANEFPGDMSKAGPYGYHAHFDVFLGRKGSDGGNVRAVIEKFCFDALEQAELIENDKYIYTTSTNCYLDRKNPRCKITLTQKEKPYQFEIS